MSLHFVCNPYEVVVCNKNEVFAGDEDLVFLLCSFFVENRKSDIYIVSLVCLGWWSGALSHATASEAAHATSAEAAASAEATHATSEAAHAASEAAHAASAATATEDVELVDDVDHAVGVDGIVARVTLLDSRDLTADVAALVENIVPLESDGECVALEEGHTCLSVPKELVGVHAG